MALEESQTEGNDLIVYSPTVANLVGKIRVLDTPLSKLNPENRIVPNGHMYAGGFSEMTSGHAGIMGKAYVRYLEEIRESERTGESLLTRFRGRFFGPAHNLEVDDRLIVEHNDTKYREQWCVDSGSRHDHLISEYDGGPTLSMSVLSSLKSEIINQRNLLLSNEFIAELFQPLAESLFQIYIEMRRF